MRKEAIKNLEISKNTLQSTFKVDMDRLQSSLLDKIEKECEGVELRARREIEYTREKVFG